MGYLCSTSSQCAWCYCSSSSKCSTARTIQQQAYRSWSPPHACHIGCLSFLQPTYRRTNFVFYSISHLTRWTPTSAYIVIFRSVLGYSTLYISKHDAQWVIALSSSFRNMPSEFKTPDYQEFGFPHLSIAISLYTVRKSDVLSWFPSS